MEAPAENLRLRVGPAGRAELRRWRVSDLDALERVVSESLDHLLPWLPWAASHSRRQVSEFLARNQEEWETRKAFGYAITSDAALVGGCGLMRRIGAAGLDIGYWLHPRWTGQGMATRATAALVGQGFRLAGVDRVEIHHDAANTASGALARRLGFAEVARVPVPEGPVAPGEVGTAVIWRLTAARWRASTQGPAE